MSKRWPTWMAAMVLGAAFGACSDLGSGGGGVIIPTQALPSVRFKLTPSVESESSGGPHLREYGIEITAASANVTDIAMPLPKKYSCEDYDLFLLMATAGTPAECRSDLDGQLLHFFYDRSFDLQAGTSEPPSDDLLVPVGKYDVLHLYFGESATAASAATAMRLQGHYSSSSTETDFDLRIAAGALTSMTLYPESSSNVVEKEGVAEFVVELSLANWLGPVADGLARCLAAHFAVTTQAEVLVGPGASDDCVDLSQTVAADVTAATAFAISETSTTSNQ